MKQWFLGAYILRLLDKRKADGLPWTPSSLAKESGLSKTYLSWIIHGRASDKASPPSLSVDAILSLSRALKVSPMDLILAYQGKDPDLYNDDKVKKDFTFAIAQLLRALPVEFVVKTLADVLGPDDLKPLVLLALESKAR